ncbi:hypothetical protein FOZ63_009118, partial [Perkinsus olseni]
VKMMPPPSLRWMVLVPNKRRRTKKERIRSRCRSRRILVSVSASSWPAGRSCRPMKLPTLSLRTAREVAGDRRSLKRLPTRQKDTLL